MWYYFFHKDKCITRFSYLHECNFKLKIATYITVQLVLRWPWTSEQIRINNAGWRISVVALILKNILVPIKTYMCNFRIKLLQPISSLASIKLKLNIGIIYIYIYTHIYIYIYTQAFWATFFQIFINFCNLYR